MLKFLDPPLVNLMDGHGVDVVKLFSAPPYEGHQIRRFENGEMLGHCLTGHIQASAQHRQTPAVVLVKAIEQLSSAGIGQRLKYRIHIVHKCSLTIKQKICKQLPAYKRVGHQGQRHERTAPNVPSRERAYLSLGKEHFHAGGGFGNLTFSELGDRNHPRHAVLSIGTRDEHEPKGHLFEKPVEPTKAQFFHIGRNLPWRNIFPEVDYDGPSPGFEDPPHLVQPAIRLGKVLECSPAYDEVVLKVKVRLRIEETP